MMEYQALLELIQSRRSIRHFTDRRPSRDDIARIVEAARWAPSNHNRQGWKFIVFDDPDALHDLAGDIHASLSERIASAQRLPKAQARLMLYYATLFAGAPCAILVMHKASMSIARELLAGAARPEWISGEPLSAALAVENMLLAAQSLGMGTCIMTGPLLAGDVWGRIDELPLGFEPTCLVALGYPAKTPAAPRKKPIEQILEYR